MGCFRHRCAVLVVSGFAAASVPAAAQFGGIFDPPRPPSNVPNRSQMPPPPVDQQRVIEPQRSPAVAAPSVAAPSVAPIPSQSLPPPPGVPADPAASPAAPGQRPPRGTPQPANTAPQPGDEVITAPPAQKIVNPTAVFSGLDKITGRITSFDVAVNETVQFGALQVTPRVCYTRPPTDTPNTDAFVEVDEVTLQGEVKRIFTGWMFAASPGLHGVEHPIYDVWLTDCKGGASAPVAEVQPAPARNPATPPARQPAPQRPRPPR
ncbi:MAG TPA: DUF2155 domain-containing protein [Xanthobacteraceae bacterium]|jgi:hypothetical protein|nr:DUF2155 domain-containing protein [Xanthobacteraceae bacterium]